MKRRRFIQYSTLGSGSLFFPLIRSVQSIQEEAIAQNIDTSSGLTLIENNHYDWIFLYWIPYDNNLSRYVAPILQMLQQGAQSDKVLVLAETDARQTESLSRHQITQNTIQTDLLEIQDSGNEENFADYLSWAKSSFSAHKWAIFILGHGGKLDEISLDSHPNSEDVQTSKWMSLKELGDIISEFNQAIENRLELIFLQNCNRGNLETNYSFRKIECPILSSQVLLGAPNYYYEMLLKDVGTMPQINGKELAQKIMNFEREDMYHSFTLTHSGLLSELPNYFNPWVESVLNGDIDAVKNFIELSLTESFSAAENSAPKILTLYHYMNESFVDLIEFVEAISQVSKLEIDQYLNLTHFIKDSLLIRVQQGGKLLLPRVRSRYQHFCGLGLLLPTKIEELELYRQLPVYVDLHLFKLFETLMFM
jgi:Clostripain family